jgi:hypothetical protein
MKRVKRIESGRNYMSLVREQCPLQIGENRDRQTENSLHYYVQVTIYPKFCWSKDYRQTGLPSLP